MLADDADIPEVAGIVVGELHLLTTATDLLTGHHLAVASVGSIGAVTEVVGHAVLALDPVGLEGDFDAIVLLTAVLARHQSGGRLVLEDFAVLGGGFGLLDTCGRDGDRNQNRDRDRGGLGELDRLIVPVVAPDQGDDQSNEGDCSETISQNPGANVIVHGISPC